ncbi:MAG: hypothetical protein RJA79_1311 [Actinomycetota bacterium]
MTPLLEARGVTKSFVGFTAVNDVSFQLQVGEITGLVGSNGAGKTTLLNSLYGKTSIDRGSIFLNGVDVTTMQASERVRLGLGMVFQLTSVFNELSVSENLRLGALAKYKEARPSSDDEIAAMLKTIGLELREFDNAANLSHGEQQWLEIGMVLLAKPQILLLDEPTSGMTKAEAAKTADLCKQLLASGAVKSIVVVEHNIDFIRRVSEKVLVMHRGSIISSGTIDEIQKDQLVRDSFLGRMK